MATLNQEIVAARVAKVVRSGKPVSLKNEMKGVYSASSARASTRLKKSPNFQALLDKHLPEDKVIKVLEEGLGATKIRFTPEGEQIDEKDYVARHKYVETTLKVRGRLKDNGTPPSTTNNFLVIGGDQLKRIATRVLDGDSTQPAASSGLPNSDQPRVHP